MTFVTGEFKEIKKLNISVLPTLTYKMENLSKELGYNIYIKRDDLTGFAFGGNKTRKLDYLFCDAIEKGCDSIVTVGSNQSNFCRITAGYAAYLGMDCYLILGGKEEEKATGNLLVDKMLNAKTIHYDSHDWDFLMLEAEKLTHKLRDEGKKVYYMPVGGSTKLGTIGYIDAFKEIVDYSNENSIHFNKIVHATGSCGTQAGLHLGRKFYKYDTEIISMSVSRDVEQVKTRTHDLTTLTSKLAKIENVDREEIIVDDNYIGEAYGVRTKEADDAVYKFAQKEGVFLDFVYTGKAAAGLIDYCKKAKFNKDDNILFLHSGGNIQIFE